MLKKVSLYTKERFPIIPLYLYSFLTVTSIGTLSEKGLYIPTILILSFIYLGFWFHLRVLDEFKDYNYDLKYHPERPVVKGEISLGDIKKAGILNVLLMFSLVFVVAKYLMIVLFLVSLGYTFLMFKEFFIKNFSDRSMVLYLISHEVVFIPLFLFFYSVFQSDFWLPGNVSSLAHLFYSLTPITLIEIGRKIKHRKGVSGEKTSDTYAYRWGQGKSIYIFAMLVTFVGLTSFLIENYSYFMSLILIFAGCLIFIGGRYFKEIFADKSMIITTLISLAVPIFLIISYYG